MRKFIENLILGLMIILVIGVQPAFAANDDLSKYVYNHLENWDTEFEISYYKADVLDVIRNIAKKDDYLTRSLSELIYEKIGNRATIKVKYRTTKEQEQYINKELTRIVNYIITNNMSDYDKIKTINKYIIDRYQYDDSLVSDNVYSALTTGKTICQGYAMTAYKMLNFAGIENKIIIGELDGVAHGWNLVKLNGKWYHLDVTNNDAVSKDKYFLKNDKFIRSSGFSWIASDYPICDENYEVTTNIGGITNSNIKILNYTTLNVSNDKNKDSNNYGQPLNAYISNLDGNWYLNDGKWYFYKNTGSYVIGWNVIDNKWYYLGSDGVMQTGWINYKEKWYYCYPDKGFMAVNTVVGQYIIDSTGAWIS